MRIRLTRALNDHWMPGIWGRMTLSLSRRSPITPRSGAFLKIPQGRACWESIDGQCGFWKWERLNRAFPLVCKVGHMPLPLDLSASRRRPAAPTFRFRIRPNASRACCAFRESGTQKWV